ncbi:MAG: lysophospholipid acyltransferase family protein [Verrucomicrobiota bacterium]
MRPLRQVTRLLGIASVLATAVIDYNMRRGWRWDRPRRASWLQVWSRTLLSSFGIRLKVIGAAPKGGFMVANHLSYLDILVLGAACPQVFLSKSEVEAWPLIGTLTKYAGTLYIDRGKRSDVTTKEAAFEEVIRSGLPMTVFLEGTSTDGSKVLPFRSSLLQPVVKNQWTVTPAYLKYECEGGDPAMDVCYWGDMTFGPHIVNMAKVKRVDAIVAFGETREPGEDRKALAKALHDDVLALRDLAEAENSNSGYEYGASVI